MEYIHRDSVGVRFSINYIFIDRIACSTYR